MQVHFKGTLLLLLGISSSTMVGKVVTYGMILSQVWLGRNVSPEVRDTGNTPQG